MCDFRNPVDVGHDVRTEDLCALNELVKDTEPKDGMGSLTWHHWIDVSLYVHVLSDDAGSSLAKPES